MSKLVWLITGASSGLGGVLAEAVLKHGHQVIATARHLDNARSAYPQIEARGGKWMHLDVTAGTTTDEVNDAVKTLGLGKIDVVVNNAGYSLIGSIEDMSEEEIHSQINTNVYGPIRVIKGVLPYFRAQKSGIIVNISSISGLDGRPACALYAASKFALEAISESLSRELSTFNIRLLIVEPGVFRTNFLSAFRTPAKGLNPAYKDTILDQTIGGFYSLHGKQAGDPEKAAERIFDVVTGTGLGAGKTGLLRLPLGPDALQRATNKADSLKKNLDDMRDIALSTNFE
ncbi:putative short chain oxidoreductase/dehydrogenase [Xylogone sp. PMI_703]|nr:putative short chain oxidoreductase/dehydrogenase [Xylogone sp. PMI_703]